MFTTNGGHYAAACTAVHRGGRRLEKNTLDLYELATDHSSVIANDTGSIEQRLDRWSGPLRLAMEPTNTYHLAIACTAQARGHPVYLVDPYRLSHYRAGIGQRVKADCQDAKLLARYLQHEAAELRRWEPLQPGPQAFWRVLRRRATLVQTIAFVALGRKIARLCFVLLRKEVDFHPRACMAT